MERYSPLCLAALYLSARLDEHERWIWMFSRVDSLRRTRKTRTRKHVRDQRSYWFLKILSVKWCFKEARHQNLKSSFSFLWRKLVWSEEGCLLAIIWVMSDAFWVLGFGLYLMIDVRVSLIDMGARPGEWIEHFWCVPHTAMTAGASDPHSQLTKWV